MSSSSSLKQLNRNNNHRHTSSASSSASGSWNDHPLLENFLLEVEEEVVESVTKAFHEKNHKDWNELPPPARPITRKQALVEKNPLSDTTRSQEITGACQILASGRGHLTTIESVSSSNRTSGTLTPLSNYSFLGPSHHRVRSSQEKDLMNRLLKMSKNESEKLLDDGSSFGDSISAITNDVVDETQSTEKKYIQKYLQELSAERENLKEMWKREFEQERKSNSSFRNQWKEKVASPCCIDAFLRFLSYAEVFISNMPLTIGAVGLSWVTQGTIWFKFMEENIDACQSAFYNSPRCSYPEFPGCFDCDVSNPTYIAVVTFHYFCHCIALICCLLFLGKCILAWTVVADELQNPATMTPIGVVCITLICVAAGRFGVVGETTVVIVSAFHVFISFWFLYKAIFVFKLQPDPSWFPCTVGIAYAAIKTWLYYPIPGFLLMLLCMIYFFGTFFTAIYRATVNVNIAAPVCFISLSAPSITMYAMTIMAQPTLEQEAQLEASPDMMTWWKGIHRTLYLPVMHSMMFLSLVGLVSSLQCLWARWPVFKKKAFSPAHVAFIFPMLSHTNSVQAYRSGVIAYSGMAVGSPYKVAIFSYWLTFLVVGTILNLIFTYKYIRKLPEWTQIYITPDDLEVEPPNPNETEVSLLWLGADENHECLRQPFTSPAVLQANEAGSLVRLRRGTTPLTSASPFLRTRHVFAVGFETVMTDDELRSERAKLLDWVAKNKARQRNKTLSIPQNFFKVESTEGLLGSNYGSITLNQNHQRSNTLGGNLHLPV